jgi:hypothetical protein
MWRLGEGAYSMEAIPAQGRQSGQPMQQGSKGARKCSTAPSVSVSASVTLDEMHCSSARRVRKPRLAFQQT